MYSVYINKLYKKIYLQYSGTDQEHVDLVGVFDLQSTSSK